MRLARYGLSSIRVSDWGAGPLALQTVSTSPSMAFPADSCPAEAVAVPKRATFSGAGVGVATAVGVAAASRGATATGLSTEVSRTLSRWTEGFGAWHATTTSTAAITVRTAGAIAGRKHIGIRDHILYRHLIELSTTVEKGHVPIAEVC
jgi:hypothetical protein